MVSLQFLHFVLPWQTWKRGLSKYRKKLLRMVLYCSPNANTLAALFIIEYYWYFWTEHKWNSLCPLGRADLKRGFLFSLKNPLLLLSFFSFEWNLNIGLLDNGNFRLRCEHFPLTLRASHTSTSIFSLGKCVQGKNGLSAIHHHFTASLFSHKSNQSYFLQGLSKLVSTSCVFYFYRPNSFGL